MKVVVLLSGGQDSVTSLFWAKHVLPTAHDAIVEAICRARGHSIGPFREVEVHALSVYYGQRHARELDAARDISRMADVATHSIVDLSSVFEGSDSALVDSTREIQGSGGMPDVAMPEGLPTSFVPGRNLLFLAVAAAHAGVVDADFIVTGVCQTDYSGYPDCRESFVKAMQGAIDAAWPSGRPAPRVLTPLMHMNKAETVHLARELPGCWEALAHSVTCYQGQRPGCRECPACVLRARGFAEAGYLDPSGNTVIHYEPSISTPVGSFGDVIVPIYFNTRKAAKAANDEVAKVEFPRVAANIDRRVERVDGATYVPIEFEEIKKGDAFRMFEPDGTPVDGGRVIIADGDAFFDGQTWGIQAKKE